MASLKDIVVQTETIKTAGGDFTVGPLTASSILSIYIGNRNSLEALFDAFKSGADTSAILVDLISTFPEIAAEVIARGSEGDAVDEETRAIARKLDFGAQLTALEKIGTLTVSSVGGLGNLAALVERLAGSLSATTAQAKSLLPAGSKASGDNVQVSSLPGT